MDVGPDKNPHFPPPLPESLHLFDVGVRSQRVEGIALYDAVKQSVSRPSRDWILDFLFLLRVRKAQSPAPNILTLACRRG